MSRYLFTILPENKMRPLPDYCACSYVVKKWLKILMYYLYIPVSRLFSPHLSGARYIVQSSQNTAGLWLKQLYCQESQTWRSISNSQIRLLDIAVRREFGGAVGHGDFAGLHDVAPVAVGEGKVGVLFDQ